MVVNFQVEISDEDRRAMRQAETGKSGMATRDEVRAKLGELWEDFLEGACLGTTKKRTKLPTDDGPVSSPFEMKNE